MKKFICTFLLIISVFVVVTSCARFDEKKKEQPTDIEFSVNYNDYTIDDGKVVFFTQVILTNHTEDDKYVSIKGDFEKEYNAGMIKEQILSGTDTETGFRVFFVPADSQVLFDVSFSAENGGLNKKPDRTSPTITIEEITEDKINTSEVVTNIATKSDGSIIIP